MTSNEDIKRTKFYIVIANVIDDDKTKNFCISTFQQYETKNNLKI